MNCSQGFKVPGSCIPDHVDVALLAEPRFAVLRDRDQPENYPLV